MKREIQYLAKFIDINGLYQLPCEPKHGEIISKVHGDNFDCYIYGNCTKITIYIGEHCLDSWWAN